MRSFLPTTHWFSCLVLTALPAAAANVVFVDDDGVCGGSAPCFSTLQLAVNNAGPGPSTVNVFAGTYASVDLSLMGSAIAAGPADLTIEGIGGGTKSVEPAAGERGIETSAGFAGSIVLRGMQVTSPDRDAIHLEGVSGDVTLEEMLVAEAGVDGLDVRNDGSLTLRNSNFNENGNDGVEATVGGSVVIDNCTANDNFGDVFMANGVQLGHDGFNVEVLDGDVTIMGSEALRNGGEGFEIHPVFVENTLYGTVGAVTIVGSEARDNGLRQPLPEPGVNPSYEFPEAIMADGFQIKSCATGDETTTPGDPCTIGDVTISNSQASNNTKDGFAILAFGDVELTDLDSRDNGHGSPGGGVEIDAPGRHPASLIIRGFVAVGNADHGIALKSGFDQSTSDLEVLLEDVLAEDNGRSLPPFLDVPPAVFPDGQNLEGIDNQGLDFQNGGPPRRITCRRCTVRRNGGNGAQLEAWELVEVEDFLAEENNKGGAEFFSDTEVRCRQCRSNRNGEDGFHMDAPTIDIQGCEASGSVIEDGLDLDDARRASVITIDDCRFQNNDEQGLVLPREQPGDVTVTISRVCAANNAIGIEVQEASGLVSIDSVQALNNERHGIRLQTVEPTTTITNSNIEGNGLSGVFLDDTGATTVTAGGNWWGAASGPFDAGDNPGGTGNALYDLSNGPGTGTVLFQAPAPAPFAALALACNPAASGPPFSGGGILEIPMLGPSSISLLTLALLALGFILIRNRSVSP